MDVDLCCFALVLNLECFSLCGVALICKISTLCMTVLCILESRLVLHVLMFWFCMDSMVSTYSHVLLLLVLVLSWSIILDLVGMIYLYSFASCFVVFVTFYVL